MSSDSPKSIRYSPEISKMNEDDSVHDGTEKVERIKTSGEQGEYVHLGGKRYLKSDLMYAFGGDFNPGLAVAPRIKLGNPSPMGLFAFGTTTLILSFINAGARGVGNPGIVLSCAIFYGGMIQTIAGLWEMVVENTFGATVFTAYGGFWLAFGTFTTNGFNIASSYTTEKELANAEGLFFVAWAVVTALFTTCTIRSTVAFCGLFVFLTLTFILLAGSEFAGANGSTTASGHLGTAAGVFGCVTAMFSYYNAMAGMMNPENSWVHVRPIFMPGAIRPPAVSKELEA